MTFFEEPHTSAASSCWRHVLLATMAIMFGLSIQTQAVAQSEEEEFDIPPSEMTDAL